ncbi:hypothetical protein AAZX31_06G061800 [Glycine max]|uniref:Uncharacterized protein n=2 Tax=Glycine subgen. Soja TaxID=1462606 RepID=I1K8Q6_SOYBN|nr:uncharacterized protein LOC100789033 [Glycine max]XP_028235199.1 uncharacterized protein LOC114414942 [Glycine soja]KAG5018593.1 hypothetical protein JHK87_014448 [Glycine soja]KAG5030925.1 hypothetical protein JHK85_014907 [Glycine max]KAG5045152.1 hypothetical protein JHK86_014558 [Glycine max]KAG5147655.1 hypothetical protein JHK82_014536 [Glycine max]KAH1124454.1 hypothetical protein GYH30_014261 [Glycine max]|eukprot:XP_003526250.1 uncharacterized protein LOC100789033 [Glycine max]
MGVAVLYPQDSLPHKPSTHYQTIIPHFPSMNPKSHRTSRNRKKRPVPGPARPTTSSKSQVNNKPPQQLVMGQVKILKRGELLSQTTPDPQPQTESVEKKTETVVKKGLTSTVEGLYAGYSMLVMSPPPSSVPLPAFITKKFAALSEATSDLREMLRLDFP